MTVQDLQNAISKDNDVEIQIYLIQRGEYSIENALYIGTFDSHPEVASCQIENMRVVDSTLIRVMITQHHEVSKTEQERFNAEVLKRLDYLEREVRALQPTPDAYMDCHHWK